MHLHFERNVNAKCDCAIMALSWMGKVPDELPEEEGWKLNRTNYYQEGWLATGNIRGVVGVTFTTSHCKKAVDYPLRGNYNLRGHRSEVILVKWNEPYQKLASCDSSGIIFVWIKYEGRWSIELINDRNTPVTHFSWSHDGRMALICYQDGFVLVGSVAGQRYWSSMLNLESTITCGIWTPDDQQVYFGTTTGQIVVMDVHGAMVSQVQLSSEVGITGMSWSSEKFKMEETDDVDSAERSFVLAVSLQNGYIYLMKSFDDVSPIQVHTGLYGSLILEWSNSRELLAVAGTIQQQSVGTQHNSQGNDTKNVIEYTNILKFYSDTGVLLYSTVIPSTQSPVTALTWGHNDKRLFVATGCLVHIAWVSRRVASLQLLCRLRIHSQLKGEPQIAQLPLPSRIKSLISNLFAQTIRCCVPDTAALREFVSRPPIGNVRLHCTMIRHDDDSNLSSGTCYTLYLEYLGGLVPLLKGKRTSKIRPEFVIYDPQMDEGVLADLTDSAKSSGSSQNAASDSDSDHEDGCASPRVQRRKRRRNKSYSGVERVTSAGQNHEGEDDLTYIDTLPEHVRLVEVTSNIWGTKFKIHGLASSVPANLGQVTYKTSLLHLQPRQMTLVMTELRDDVSLGPDPSFNPNLFSEDEDENIPASNVRRLQPSDMSPPIAPMTPRLQAISRERFGPSIPRGPTALLLNSDPRIERLSDIIIMTNPRALTLGPAGGGELQNRERLGVGVHRPAPYVNGEQTIREHFAQNSQRAGQLTNVDVQNRIGSNVAKGSLGALAKAQRDRSPALAKAESIEDELPFLDLAEMLSFCESIRASSASVKNYVENLKKGNQNFTGGGGGNPIPSSAPAFNGNGPYNGTGAFAISQYRSNVGASNTNPRHPSPLVCDGVPTLQSPKNAVAPSEIVDVGNPGVMRMSATSNDHANNVQRVKATMTENSSMNLNSNVGTFDPNFDLRPVVMKQIHVEGNNKCLSQSVATETSDIKGLNSNNAINLGKRKEKFDKSSPTGNQPGKTASKPCTAKPEDLLYIDEDVNANPNPESQDSKRPANPTDPKNPLIEYDSMVRSCSLGYLDMVEAQLVPCDIARFLLRVETPKRLVLVDRKNKQRTHRTKQNNHELLADRNINMKSPKLKHCRKSKSLDSGDLCPLLMPEKTFKPLPSLPDVPVPNTKITTINENSITISPPSPVLPKESTSSKMSFFNSRKKGKKIETSVENDVKATPKTKRKSLAAHLESLTMSRTQSEDTRSLPPSSPCPSPRLPRSSPASPQPSKKGKRNQSSSPIRKRIMNSPLLNRRKRSNKTESSDDEVVQSGDEVFDGKNYKDLESFQKAQLRQKLKRGKGAKGVDSTEAPLTPPIQQRKEFVMHNKAPMWNENSQVYQLDFGGRVTQESAKNFQIEFRGKQVMQFGRIDGNAYTLDFQYPFSALQAFAVALANVTQRLK